MNFSKIYFKVNICLDCTLVSDNNISNIILEEDDEINQSVNKCVQLKNFLIKNIPLVIRLLESKYSCVSMDEINSILNQLNINFKEEQLNSEEYLDKYDCIGYFNRYINGLVDDLILFGKLIIIKVKNSDQVKYDISDCSSCDPINCIYKFLDSLKKNQKDIRLSNDESLLEIYMDFLSMCIFIDKVICQYKSYRFLIIPIIKVKKKMLSSYAFNSKNVLHPFKFDKIYSPEIKESLFEKVLYYISQVDTEIINIENDEEIQNFLKEFSKYIVEIIILIEKYNYSYNYSLTRFTINSCIFKYFDNNNDDLRNEIQQLNIKLLDFLFIESENYNTKLSFYIKIVYFKFLNSVYLSLILKIMIVFY
ncbi:hypothetical protein A0H76_1390 [Hepatospora eriocheir]|uniref:Uncharacterized protein n=1 Tax=Hepatospora eriocheir TaxID=1081669 RepID=A0A1X0QH74_9MICR|nr:hypothetical protein A0H76_1390 [Hepatospora eriocheir]